MLLSESGLLHLTRCSPVPINEQMTFHFSSWMNRVSFVYIYPMFSSFTDRHLCRSSILAIVNSVQPQNGCATLSLYDILT